jgi:hypothetical protein
VLVGPTSSSDPSGGPGDPNYSDKRGMDVVLTNLDDDGAAIRVTAAPDLRTTEAGGTARFTVALASAPTGDVAIPLASSDPAEGRISEPSAQPQLTFTAANWSIPQTVTIAGVDDNDGDGNVPYAIRFLPATSSDSRYSGRTTDDVRVTNIDDDSPGITITAPPNLTTTEVGGTATFRIVLNKAPTAGVTITVRSSNEAEGTAAPGTIRFSADDWNVAQTVTITGVQDTETDGNQLYLIILEPVQSSDPGYGTFILDPLVVTNLDDDMPPAPKHRPAVRTPRPSPSAHPAR